MRIDDMKPGPELDVQLAKLFGYQIDWEGRHDKHPLYLNGEKGWFMVPQYSTTWEGMRLVVEEMQRRGYAWRIEGLRAAFFDPYAGSPADDGSMVYAEALGETTPHAVVLAAIGALQDELIGILRSTSLDIESSVNLLREDYFENWDESVEILSVSRRVIRSALERIGVGEERT
jgi:hypothetical protein